jgi:hypothetical protein
MMCHIVPALRKGCFSKRPGRDNFARGADGCTSNAIMEYGTMINGADMSDDRGDI